MPVPNFPRLSFTPFLGALALGSFLAGTAILEGQEKQPSKPKPKTENLGFTLSPEQQQKVAKLKEAKDPDQEETKALEAKWRGQFEKREFDQLEKTAAELRNTKALNGGGRWKILSFYSAFLLAKTDKEEICEEHAKIHADWIAAHPQSITPRVAQAYFLVDYAWRARGSGYRDTVTTERDNLMQERFADARQGLINAQLVNERDQGYFYAEMNVALGEGWPVEAYDDLMKRAYQVEPKLFSYDTSRAYSLLPRWYGKSGDWEAFADKAAARPDGLGMETYARIVMNLSRYYSDIFRESKASWPKTREGLQILRKKYPQSVEILHYSAMLAAYGEDRAMAKELFDQIGDNYLPSVFRKPEIYEHCRHWAETGKW